MVETIARIGRRRLWQVVLALALVIAASFSAGRPALAANGGCLDDVTGTTNNCGASDVQVSQLFNRETISCTAGEMVTIYLRADLLAGANERYDIGLFVATDGGNAKTGSCYQDYLPPLLAGIDTYNPGSPLPGPDGGPFYNAEADTDAVDTCGDLEKGAHTYYDLAPGTGISVPCVDSDRDGYLDIGTCVSWDNTDNNTCTSVDQAVPNTKSKCRCALVRVGNVTVEPGEIGVTKTADPTTVNEPGDTVTFTFLVENPSGASITAESLVDSVFGNLATYPGSTCAVPQVIGPGGSYSCSIPGDVTGQPGIHTNVVTVTGTDEYGNGLEASDPAEVTILDLLPSIAVVKSANPESVVEPGGMVLYTVQVTNNSVASDPVTLTSLVDSLYGNLVDGGNTAISNSTCSLGTIQPGNTYQCTFRAPVTGVGGNQVVDLVTAAGQDNEQNPVQASDDATVTITAAPEPAIAVVKTADPASIVEPGGAILYTVRVTNNSPAGVVVELTDLLDNIYGDLVDAGNAAISNSTCTLAIIHPGNAYQCTFQAQVTGPGGSQVTDLVSATAIAQSGKQAQASDDATVTITVAPTPIIAVIKTVTPEIVMAPGDTVLYTVQVQNNSPAGVPVTLTELKDNLYGNLVDGSNTAISNSTCTLATIQPGNSYFCTFQALVAGSGGEQVTNVVTARAVAQSGKEAQDSDDATVAITSTPIPKISVDKRADPTTVVEPGDEVKYTVRVRNDSPAGVPVTLIALQDNVYGNLVDAANLKIWNSTCALVTIQPGDAYQCTFMAEVMGDPGDKVIDVVTVTGRDPNKMEVKAADDATVTVVAKPPDTGVDFPAPFIFGLLLGFGVALVGVGTWIGRRVMRSD
jgi:uncharacterized repeat protein (TIGR01451 family)